MSQENVEVVKIAYRAFEGAPDDRGPMHGKAAVRAWFQDWIDMFDEFRMELVELVDAGEDTLVIAERYGGRAKLSGVDTDSTVWTVLTVYDGRIARGREYPSRRQAVEAAGRLE